MIRDGAVHVVREVHGSVSRTARAPFASYTDWEWRTEGREMLDQVLHVLRESYLPYGRTNALDASVKMMQNAGFTHSPARRSKTGVSVPAAKLASRDRSP